MMGWVDGWLVDVSDHPSRAAIKPSHAQRWYAIAAAGNSTTQDGAATPHGRTHLVRFARLSAPHRRRDHHVRCGFGRRHRALECHPARDQRSEGSCCRREVKSGQRLTAGDSQRRLVAWSGTLSEKDAEQDCATIATATATEPMVVRTRVHRMP